MPVSPRMRRGAATAASPTLTGKMSEFEKPGSHSPETSRTLVQPLRPPRASRLPVPRSSFAGQVILGPSIPVYTSTAETNLAQTILTAQAPLTP